MRIDYSEKTANWVRRKDREVESPEWITQFLQQAAWGNLAMAANERPFINSNLFFYDVEKHAIYMHTAHEGRTRFNAMENKEVCFSTSEMGRLLPAPFARNFSVEYKGVVVFGTVSIVEEMEEAVEGLQKLLDKYFPHLSPEKDYRPIQAQEVRATTVYRIDISAWSAKQKLVEEDFKGAFWYGLQPESQSQSSS